jgi:RNA polymerase sigma-70 factor (ECF subfamily)
VAGEPPVSDDSDAVLITRAQAGDAEAFGGLVQRYMRQAYFSAIGLVGSREDALDLSQEAFARAFNARASIDPDRPFYAWYYTILRRLCFNWLRDRRARREALDASGWWLAEVAAVTVDGPDVAAERHETHTRVARALAQLGDVERETLVLKEFEGLKYREIAERMECPIGTVMSRLYAARQHLARVLEEP